MGIVQDSIGYNIFRTQKAGLQPQVSVLTEKFGKANGFFVLFQIIKIFTDIFCIIEMCIRDRGTGLGPVWLPY